MSFTKLSEILDFAIKNEEEAAVFYTDLAEKMDRPAMKKVFLDFAKEEQGHKAKLLGIKEGKIDAPVSETVVDLELSDYLVADDGSDPTNYQDALILAIKNEKSAFKLYTELAEMTENAEFRRIFSMLAQEEAKHKLRFELEYDDQFLQDN